MTHTQILINQMSFNLPTGKALFNELSLAFSKHKTGLVGRNGIGKSTLIKLILGELCPNSGSIHIEGRLAHVPQSLPISPEMTIAGLLGCEEKTHALHRIMHGSIDVHDFSILNEEWDIDAYSTVIERRFRSYPNGHSGFKPNGDSGRCRTLVGAQRRAFMI